MTALYCLEFCWCDPVLCATDDTDDHCADTNCAMCLHGCPSGDDCDNPAHWVTPIKEGTQ